LSSTKAFIRSPGAHLDHPLKQEWPTTAIDCARACHPALADVKAKWQLVRRVPVQIGRDTDG
jgi:hypothetical protein